MGDTIMVRSFAPLPRLEEITFLRPDTKVFVTGQGPYPLSLPAWFPFILLLGAVPIGGLGLYNAFATWFPEQVLGRPLQASDDWMIQIAPVALVLVVVEIGMFVWFRRQIRNDRKLGILGGLIGGELVASKVKAAKGGNYLQAECRFTSPQGQVITGKKSVGRPDRRLKAGPPVSSKVLILYESDRLWQVL